MNIEEQLNSDDIEVAALYADILLKKDVKRVEELFKQSTKYRLDKVGRRYYLNQKYSEFWTQVPSGGYIVTSRPTSPSYTTGFISFTDEVEGIKLNYRNKKEKKHLKKPMFNNFLQPKKYLKYGHRKND